MSTNHCFETGTVVPDLRSTDKFEALRELIRRAPVFRELNMRADVPGGFSADVPGGFGADGFRAAFAEVVIERERQQTTGFGHGVAVAHGRVKGVPRVLIALGISRAGIPYDSPDGEPVHLLFVIASPPELSLDYLQALSTLVRCIHEKPDRDSLIDAASAVDIEERLRAAFSARLRRFEEPLPEGNAAFGGRGRTPRGSSG